MKTLAILAPLALVGLALLTLLLRRARDQHDIWPQGADDDERILAVIAEAQREAGRARRFRSLSNH